MFGDPQAYADVLRYVQSLETQETLGLDLNSYGWTSKIAAATVDYVDDESRPTGNRFLAVLRRWSSYGCLLVRDAPVVRGLVQLDFDDGEAHRCLMRIVGSRPLGPYHEVVAVRLHDEVVAGSLRDEAVS